MGFLRVWACSVGTGNIPKERAIAKLAWIKILMIISSSIKAIFKSRVIVINIKISDHRRSVKANPNILFLYFRNRVVPINYSMGGGNPRNVG
jgi:hypothetical protein